LNLFYYFFPERLKKGVEGRKEHREEGKKERTERTLPDFGIFEMIDKF
jgi:hypothetical protein